MISFSLWDLKTQDMHLSYLVIAIYIYLFECDFPGY